MAAASKQARTLWEVIVALSEAYLAGRSMAASDIHLAAGLSRSTARRYVRMLEQLGIFLRRPNMADKRRVLIELTYPFSKRVDQYVNECFEEFEDLITIHHDCERLKAKNALKEIDAHVHLLTDSTVEGIYGIDLGGNCTFANSSCLNSLGYEEHDDLLGKNMHALRESEKRKRFILQSALDAIVTMDEDGRVLEFNPSAERIFATPWTRRRERKSSISSSPQNFASSTAGD